MMLPARVRPHDALLYGKAHYREQRAKHASGSREAKVASLLEPRKRPARSRRSLREPRRPADEKLPATLSLLRGAYTINGAATSIASSSEKGEEFTGWKNWQTSRIRGRDIFAGCVPSIVGAGK